MQKSDLPKNSSSGLLLFITLISREFTSLRTKRKVKGSFEVQCSLKSYVSNRAPWGPQIMILFWGADVLWPLSSFATVTLARRGQVICRYLLWHVSLTQKILQASNTYDAVDVEFHLGKSRWCLNLSHHGNVLTLCQSQDPCVI